MLIFLIRWRVWIKYQSRFFLSKQNFKILLLGWHLSSISPNREHVRRSTHIDLIGISPPWGSPTAAIFGCDGFITLDFWLDGSIIVPSACHRRHWIYLSMSESWRYIKYVRSYGLSVPNSRRKVSDVLILNFQRAMPVLWKKKNRERELTLSPVSSLKGVSTSLFLKKF